MLTCTDLMLWTKCLLDCRIASDPFFMSHPFLWRQAFRSSFKCGLSGHAYTLLPLHVFRQHVVWRGLFQAYWTLCDYMHFEARSVNKNTLKQWKVTWQKCSVLAQVADTSPLSVFFLFFLYFRHFLVGSRLGLGDDPKNACVWRKPSTCERCFQMYPENNTAQFPRNYILRFTILHPVPAFSTTTGSSVPLCGEEKRKGVEAWGVGGHVECQTIMQETVVHVPSQTC